MMKIRNHTGGPRPMISVPLTVVASRAVGFANNGRMPMIARMMMMTRPALKCLQYMAPHVATLIHYKQ